MTGLASAARAVVHDSTVHIDANAHDPARDNAQPIDELCFMSATPE
jgi:hypothetical protein